MFNIQNGQARYEKGENKWYLGCYIMELSRKLNHVTCISPSAIAVGSVRSSIGSERSGEGILSVYTLTACRANRNISH